MITTNEYKSKISNELISKIESIGSKKGLPKTTETDYAILEYYDKVKSKDALCKALNTTKWYLNRRYKELKDMGL
jgi:hypothetical protein